MKRKFDELKTIVSEKYSNAATKKMQIKDFGEVMTPFSLVDQMLNLLPAHIWLDPSLKWLDPCCGMGTFFICVLERLMMGLESSIPEENQRFTHIVEKMLFACEIQQEKALDFTNIMLHGGGGVETLHPNVFIGDFVKESLPNHFPERFDVILANPPFNSNHTNRGAHHTLWDKFVVKCGKMLTLRAYMSMVHPAGWRNVSGSFSKVRETIFSKSLVKLVICNENQGKAIFKVNTRYDFYLLENDPSSSDKKTEIIDENGCVEHRFLKIDSFIPNFIRNIIHSLFAKPGEPCVEIVPSTYQWKREDSSGNACIYSISMTGTPKLYFSKTQVIDKRPKFIFQRAYSTGSLLDLNGEFLLTQWCSGIYESVENLEPLQKAFQNPKFQQIILAIAFRREIHVPTLAKFKKDFWKEF